MRDNDYIGKRFGRLVVIKSGPDRLVGKRNIKKRTWECVCDCGTTTVVLEDSLRSGNTKSCGCLKKQVDKHKFDDADLTGKKYGKFTVLGQSSNDSHGNRRWKCLCDCGRISYVRTSPLIKGVILSCGHENRGQNLQAYMSSSKFKEDLIKGYDARKTAMGIQDRTNRSELKSIVSGHLQKNNTSGYTGVYKKGNKWEARISFKGQSIYLGLFLDKSEAIKARKKAEEELFEPEVDILKKMEGL